MGPLEFFVIALDHERFAGAVLPELLDHLTSGSVRLVDLVIADKNDEGLVEISEIEDLDSDAAALFEAAMADVIGLLTPEDVIAACEDLPAGATAVVALFEHTWAERLQLAVADAGGVVALHGRASEDTLLALADELSAHADA